MTTTPAEIVIDRFGGIKAVADALGLERTAVQRWTYPRLNGTRRSTGTGGAIPQRHWPRLIECAKSAGIELSPDDLMPPELRG